MMRSKLHILWIYLPATRSKEFEQQVNEFSPGIRNFEVASPSYEKVRPA